MYLIHTVTTHLNFFISHLWYLSLSYISQNHKCLAVLLPTPLGGKRVQTGRSVLASAVKKKEKMLLFKGNSAARPITSPRDDLSADPPNPSSSAECAYFGGPPLMSVDMFGSFGGGLTISINLHERAFGLLFSGCTK